MEWKKEYEIGVEEIDLQHKKLVEIVNGYIESMSDNTINLDGEIVNILVYLINYSTFHFKSEEALMERVEYPGLKEHKLIHKNIKIELINILSKIKKKESFTSVEFYYFLMSWVNNHILDVDLKIGNFCKSKNQELKIIKVTLKTPQQGFKPIMLNLKSIESSYIHKLIDKNDKEQQRVIYLENYIDTFNLENEISLKNVIALLEMLENQNIIQTTEKEYIFDKLKLTI